MTAAAYREVQRFRQPWLWSILLLPSVVAGYVFFRQVVLGHPVGARPLPDPLARVLLPVLAVGLPGFFALLRLETRLEADRLVVHFFPLRRRVFPLEALRSAEAVRYRPLADYGGWGIRLGAGGWAYTVSGDAGVRLTLKDGESFLLGSRMADRLAGAVQSRLQGSAG